MKWIIIYVFIYDIKSSRNILYDVIFVYINKFHLLAFAATVTKPNVAL